MTKVAVSRRNGPKFEKKNRQIEGKTSKVSRICDFLVNFDWSKFKIRKEIRQIGGRTSNRQHWPTGKLISEFFLVVPSISRIFRPKASRLQFDTKFVKLCLLCPSFFAQSLVLVQMSRKTWTKLVRKVC